MNQQSKRGAVQSPKRDVHVQSMKQDNWTTGRGNEQRTVNMCFYIDTFYQKVLTLAKFRVFTRAFRMVVGEQKVNLHFQKIV